MESVHRSSLCVMGISKQAEGACLPLLNTYIVSLKAAHFRTYSWPEYMYIYNYIYFLYMYFRFCGLFSRDILSAVVRQ